MINGELVLQGENNNKGNKPQLVKPRKGYVYLAPNIKRDEEFIKPYSHTFIFLTTEVQKEWKDNEIEIYTTDSNGEVVSSTSSNSTNASTIRVEKTLNFYTEDFKGSAETGKVYWITLDRPLNVLEVIAGTQPVYKFSDLNPAEYIPENLDGLLNVGGSTEGILEEKTRLTDSFDKANLYFTFTNDRKVVNKFSLFLSKYFMPNYGGIKVIGTTNDGVKEPIELTTEMETLTPLLANIVEEIDKITIYLPWFDHDISPRFKLAKQAKQSFKLKDFEELNQDNQVIYLLLDLFMLAYGYDDEFSFVEYVVSGTDAGKIKGDQFIGYQPKQVSSIVGKTPREVADSRYKRFLKETGYSKTDPKVRAIKQIVASLSNYLSSSLAVGKGENDFHSVYLPFYLEFFGSLKPKKVARPNPNTSAGGTVQSWVLDADEVFVRTNSKYFTIKEDGLVNAIKQAPSQLAVVQLDTKLVLPTIPDVVKSIDKLPKAQDLDPSSSKDLQYLFYINIDKTKLNDFLSSEERFDINVPAGKEIISSTPSQFPTKIGSIYEKNLAGATKLFNDIGFTGNFVSGEVEELEKTQEINVALRIDDFGDLKEIVVDGSIYKAMDLPNGANGWTLGEGYTDRNHPRNDSPGMFMLARQIEITKKWDNGVISSISIAKTSNETGIATIKIKEYRLTSGFKYSIKQGGVLSQNTNDREAVFDKTTFKKLIDIFSPLPVGQNISIEYAITMAQEAVIDEIDIRGLFGEQIRLRMGNEDFTIKSFNVDDERITIDRIIFR